MASFSNAFVLDEFPQHWDIVLNEWLRAQMLCPGQIAWSLGDCPACNGFVLDTFVQDEFHQHWEFVLGEWLCALMLCSRQIP